LTTILISFFGAIIASLLTVFLAPRVHHAFWSRQRIAELRLATYDKVNGITASIYVLEPAAGVGVKMAGLIEPLQLSPFQNLLASLMTAGDEVKNRFSESALTAYQTLEVLVTVEGLPKDKRTKFSEAREAVLKQLHAESLRGFLARTGV
jgi:hypothetical protein